MDSPPRLALLRLVGTVLLFLVQTSQGLYGQDLILYSDIKAEKVSAISFDVPERQETVVLLIGPLEKATGWFQTFLLKDGLDTLKRGARIKVDMDVNSAENTVKYMGQYQDDANGYVWWEFSNTFGKPVRGIKLDFKTLNVSVTGALEGNLRQEWWGGLDCSGTFYMLGKKKRNKEGTVINICAFEASTGKFKERSLHVPEESVLANKAFSTFVRKPDRCISQKHQLFVKDSLLCCLSENKTGLLMVTVIDPEELTITDRQIMNPPGFANAKARSVLTDDKIFRVLSTQKALKISVHAFTDGAVLFSDSVTEKMPSLSMFSSPVVYIGPVEEFRMFKQRKNDTIEIQGATTFLNEIDRAQEYFLYLGVTEVGYKVRLLTNHTLMYSAGPNAQTYLNTHLHALVALNKDLTKMPPLEKTDVFGFTIPYRKRISSGLFMSSYDPDGVLTYMDYPFHTIYAKRYIGYWDEQTQTYSLRATAFN